MADKFEFPGFVGLSAMQSLVFSFVLWTLGQVLGIFCLFLLVFWCNLFGLFLGVGSLALVLRFSLPCLRKLTLCLLKKKPPFVSITQYSRKITLILFDRTAGTTLWGVSYLAALGKSFFPFSVPLPGWFTLTPLAFVRFPFSVFQYNPLEFNVWSPSFSWGRFFGTGSSLNFFGGFTWITLVNFGSVCRLSFLASLQSTHRLSLRVTGDPGRWFLPMAIISQYFRKIYLILFELTVGTLHWGLSYLAVLGKYFLSTFVPILDWVTLTPARTFRNSLVDFGSACGLIYSAPLQCTFRLSPCIPVDPGCWSFLVATARDYVYAIRTHLYFRWLLVALLFVGFTTHNFTGFGLDARSTTASSGRIYSHGSGQEVLLFLFDEGEYANTGTLVFEPPDAVVKSWSTRVVAGSTPDVKITFCQGRGLSSAAAGETAGFTVTSKDTPGNILRDGTRVVQSRLSVVNDANAMSVSVGGDEKKLYTAVTAGHLYAFSPGLMSSFLNSGGLLLQSTAGRDARGNLISSLPPGVVLHEAKSYTTQSSCALLTPTAPFGLPCSGGSCVLCNSDSATFTQKSVPGTNYIVSFKAADLRVCGCSYGVPWIGQTLKLEALVNGELADTFVGSGTNSWAHTSFSFVASDSTTVFEEQVEETYDCPSEGRLFLNWLEVQETKIPEFDVKFASRLVGNSLWGSMSLPCNVGSVNGCVVINANVSTHVQSIRSRPVGTRQFTDGVSLYSGGVNTKPSGFDAGALALPGSGNVSVTFHCAKEVASIASCYSSASCSSTVEKATDTSLYSSTVGNNTFSIVGLWKGGSRPSSPTLSPLLGKARHVPPIPVGPYSAGTLPLRGSSSAAPTPLLLQEGGKASRTGAVAGASPSGAAPATLPLSGVDARSCHYCCGGDEHRTLLLPHGRKMSSAVPHCLVLPSGEEKRQPFAALVSKGAKVVSSPTGSVLPALYAAFRALGQQASLEDPGGEAVFDVGSPTRTTSPPRRSQFSPGPLSSQTGSVVEGCGVLSPLSGGAVARVCVKMGGNSHCLRRAAGPLCGAASVRTVDYVCVMGGCLQRRSMPPYRWCAVGAVCLVDRPCQRFVLPGVVVRGGTSAPPNCTAAFTTVASSLVLTDATVSPSQVNSTDTDATVYSKTTASPSSSTALTSLPAAQANPPLSLPVAGRGGGGAAAENYGRLAARNVRVNKIICPTAPRLLAGQSGPVESGGPPLRRSVVSKGVLPPCDISWVPGRGRGGFSTDPPLRGSDSSRTTTRPSVSNYLTAAPGMGSATSAAGIYNGHAEVAV